MTDKAEVVRFRELRFVLRMLTRTRFALAAIAVILLFYVMAVDPGLFTSLNPDKVDMSRVLISPSWSAPLGTDSLGRDILARVIWGTQYSMVIGPIVVILQTVVGLPLGAVAGYFGGKVDNVIMRVTDMFLAFPGLVLAVFFAYILGKGLIAVFIALALVQWTYTARLVRSIVMVEREKEYATAGRALGMGKLRILFDEILPNSIQPVIVVATLSLGSTIVQAAGLSFIGVGLQPPTPDWGNIISDAQSHILDNPSWAIVPGLFVIAVVLCFNIIGDALTDALDPRLRREIM